MKNKKPGFVDPDSDQLLKGKQKLIEESKSWKAPNHKQREEELRELKKHTKRGSQSDGDKASWKKKIGGVVALLFLCGVGLFNFLNAIWGLLGGSGLSHVDVQDTANLKALLFGGQPWLVYCVNNQTLNYPLPTVLEEGSGQLWRSLGVQVGVLRCWDSTASGRSVAQRFGLKRSPPLSFVVANGNKPRVVDFAGISKIEDLERKMLPALALEVHKIDALKKWPNLCTSRRSCIVVGHKHQAQKETALNMLKPLLEQYRSTKLVTLDTSFWQLKLENKIAATRKNKGGADVLCLARTEPTGSGNATFGGLFFQEFDSSSAAAFFKACSEHSDLVPMSAAPKIKARPSKPKKVVSTPQRPQSQPVKQKPKERSNVDRVGSRTSLDQEEPLFEAVEETADEEQAGDGSDEGEDGEEVETDEVEL